MAKYSTNRPGTSTWSNRFHDSLIDYGYIPGSWRIFSGGTLGADGITVETDEVYQSTLESITDNANSLTLTCLVGGIAKTQVAINSDPPEEAVITCAELPTVFDYKIWDESFNQTTGTITDGSLEVTLLTAGFHMVEIREQGAYRTGYIQLEGIMT